MQYLFLDYMIYQVMGYLFFSYLCIWSLILYEMFIEN